MLLNLTNHPSTRWTNKQLTTALAAYGQVKDLPFPPIPPTDGPTEIAARADEYAHDIEAMQPSAVHLQGEMVFTYALTKRLLARGMPVIASASERKVEMVDGRKVVQFDFVRFRAYQ